MTPSRDIARLLDIMAALRDPETGCSWDLAQTFASIVPYTIEESYEVADAVERGHREDLREELGDLLLQVVFQARIAEEEGSFDFGGVVEAITTKLVHRHPHIFGEKRDLSPDEVRATWAAIKHREKADRAARERIRPKDPAGRGAEAEQGGSGLLSAVGAGLPPLPRAVKLQAKAAGVGFDWNDFRAVLAKVREEAAEVEAALDDPRALAGEIGDLLFAVANLARHAGVDPEAALRSTNRKFERRFSHIEAALQARGIELGAADLDAMEALWREAKALEERTGRPGSDRPTLAPP